MLLSQSLRTGLGLLSLTLGACTTAPPSPLAEDHPASIYAPAAAVQTEPSALTAYRDFGTAPSTPPRADAPPMDHSMHQQHEQGGPSPMHQQHEQGGPSPMQDDPESAHADHH